MYAIELPRQLLGRLALLRSVTGKPIAKQVREAVQDYLEREKLKFVGVEPGEEAGHGDSQSSTTSS